MTSKIGATSLTAMKIGSTNLVAVRLGTVLVFSSSPLRDEFNRADQTVLTFPWVNETPSAAYHAGVEGNACRLALPDGLSSQARVDSRFRHSTQLTSGDGDLEIRVAHNGTLDYRTQVFRRYSNDGTGAAGVGIDLCQSRAGIVRRIGSVDTIMDVGGGFTGGSILRLTQAGNVHTLYRNGNQIGKWTDSGLTAANTSSTRSIALHVQAAKEALGPRRFSPSLDYIQAT